MKWLWALALFTSQVWAFDPIDTGSLFPAVVQGHHGDSSTACYQINGYQLGQLNNAKINGSGGLPLNFCSIQPDQNNTRRCDDGAGGYKVCTVTGSDVRGLTLSSSNNKFPTITTNNDLTCTSGSQTGSGAAYRTVLLDNCTLTFPSRSETQIKTLTLRNKATLILGSGDYFIDKLNIDNVTIRLSGSGITRIFVNQDVTFFNTVSVNSNNQGSLIWVNYGNMVLDNGTTFYGYLYSDNKLTMNNYAAVYGRVTARYLSMDAQSSINEAVLPPMLTCFADGFDSAQINPDSWVVAQRNNSTLPSVQNGRLRLTQNITDQATSATFQRLFPGAGNLVTVEFDQYAYKTSGTSGADGMAVVLSDATLTPQPGAFGGPLGYGYKPGSSGFAGGWLGVGLDEYGNYANEGGSNSPGSRPQAVSIRGSGSGTSGYRYLTGTASNLNPPVDSGTNSNRPHRYRITVDSRSAGNSLATVERDTGAGYSTLVGPINMTSQTGQAAVPANFLLSLTGSTGSVTNFHEIDNVRICALRSNPVGVQIDHFQLDHSGQALTCNPETVTINACADAACTTLIKDPVTATLSLTPTSVSNGWIGGNTVTFSGGSTTVQLRNNTATAVTIGVSGSVPTTKPFSTTLCKAGAGMPSAAACTLSFADSGFFFDVPDTYSNQPQTVAIKAVKKSDVTKQCVPGFANQSKSVKFWSSYVSPASNSFNSGMSVNNTLIGSSQGNATAFSLNFDAQGQSSITVKYPDAGKVQLDARYDGTGNEAGLVMLGSDQFVARPVGLCITPSQGICSAGDSSCPVFKKAGDTFQIDIKAMAWESATDGDICVGNQTTPNFVLPKIALGSTLVAPNPGTNAAMGTATYNHVPASNSLNSVTQTVSEVGVFRMTATPPVAMQPEGSTVSTGYFGYTIPPASSVPVGRFIPADFNLASGDIVPACNVFSYMGQPFGVALDVLARNVSGGQTRNYTGSFAKGSAYLSVANNKDGKSLANRLRSLPSLPWLNGRAALAAGSSEFVRLSDTQPDGPYKSLLFGLYMRDNDGDRTLIASPDFNDAVVGNCSGASCNARLIDSVPMQVYFGRLLAGTGAGLASAPLAVPLQLQYYEADNWQLNKLDQCTQFSLANQGFTFLNPGHVFDAASRDLSLGNNRKILLGLGSSAPGGASAQTTDGEILFQFARPDIPVRIPYRVDLSKQPSQPLWLSDPATLQGEAIFGSSRGNDRIIYRREVMH
ncbi:TPA: MSHA biogenesis protein MshQ [Aeromonas hydrophila subsp. hydrophila]|uniref:MSHA biogenesis protein MshQ n=2 Tax=Aeromonas hydrophila TaxID=644 RepID=A0ABD7G5D5_AERHY|nr:MSHA biogenesis protein MshQ [Aeromonas hydrophila]MBC8689170.1 MSHA biogenesis protein MshQ [Aeromonas hydrophila]RCF47803.1 MSHA biogenesis protein MshQ [Aeromonas hydrophila]